MHLRIVQATSLPSKKDLQFFDSQQRVSPPRKSVVLRLSDVDTAEERGLVPGQNWAGYAGRKLLRQKRDTLSEATVTLRTVVTFVTWLIPRTEFLV